MKLLVAIAVLVLAVAGAVHVSEHTLRGPRFDPHKLYKYDIEFNMTAGVLGLSSQVSASVLRAEVSIYALTEKNCVLKIENVVTSGSVKDIDNKYGDIPLRPNRELEDRLSSPIMFTLEDGKVTSYTLSRKENLESKKIKKSILRSLEMYVPESALQELDTFKNANVPVTYNTTEDTEFGVHTTQYMIIASPDAEFPHEKLVYNISRSDNFEGERYPSHILHHNFQKQGCSEVCRKDWKNNGYGAGCPIGYEPHQSPIKTSFSHQHDLSAVGHAISPDVIRTIEVHFAKMYDQDMEVLIRYQMRRTLVTSGSLSAPSGQRTYTDLGDMEAEINEKEIDDLCDYKKTADYVVSAKNLLSEISRLIVKGELEKEETTLVSEKVILLRDVLAKLNSEDLLTVSRKIKSIQYLTRATDEEKVARQIWLNILPVIGTSESVKFIVRYVQDYNNLLKWEIKDILEALPQNIHLPTGEEIRELRELTQKMSTASHHLHSAVYITLARVIGKTCGNVPIVRSKLQSSSPWLRKFQLESKSKMYPSVSCPEPLVSEIVEEITRNLRSTRKPGEMVVYIEALSHIGTHEVLPVIAEYIYGTADNIQESSPRFVNFMKTMAQFALHNIAGKYPEEVLKIVSPVFFNETEAFKVRNAAFGVLIRCQPSLDILQKVAIRSWTEKSSEVGSYVTSTLDTFGNSSLPCMQLTAHRIKVIMPQLRRFDLGIHHSKNVFWNYFDDLRGFGEEKRFEYIPNNESYIPSVVYKSLSYSMDSLTDVVSQIAINSEGITEEKVMEKINEYFRVSSIPTIEDEAEVFGDRESGMSFIKPRIPDDLRLTFHSKMFYQSSFYYFDIATYRQAREDLMEVFTKYLKSADRTIKGYLVKLMIPSSYHTVTIAKTLPYPVEFQMSQPLVLALNVKSPERKSPSRDHFNLQLKPSVYFSKLITHQIKNLGDCKEVGVYHENKIAATHPFQIKYEGERYPNVTIKYKIPHYQNRIFAYFSESGTYAGKKESERLPSSVEREPIRTLPTPFKFEKELRIVGMPPILVQFNTEDMNIFREKLPRNYMEYVDMATKRILNAGWRYKSVNITFLEDSSVWTKDTEVTFNVKYLHQHVPSLSEINDNVPDEDEDEELNHRWSSSSRSQRQTSRQSPGDEDWTKYLKPFTIADFTDPSVLTKTARRASRILNDVLPHMNHVLNVSVETQPQRSMAYFRMEYNHTYSRNLHALHIDTVAQFKDDEHAYEMSCDHLMGFWNLPNEFTYNSGYGKQQAGFITGFSLPNGEEVSPWEKVEIAAMGHMKYVSNKEILEDELLGQVESKYFLPENHEQCLEDVRHGMPLSVDCVKAIRELSMFNKYKMYVLWKQDLPKSWRQFFRRLDIYMKHDSYEHLNVTEGGNMEHGIKVEMDYIDKLVDKPVVDIEITKPTETIMLERVPVRGFHRFSSVYGSYENSLLQITNNSYPATCTRMENYVKTYDLVTYPFSPQNCYYVLSAHCSKRKNFAVILHSTEEIYVHVGTNTLILTPKKSNSENYVVRFDGKEYEIHHSLLLDPINEIYVYTEAFERGNEHITVVAKRAGIKVIYDGKITKVMVDSRYKGELCGLCSEFDGETLREFRGMDRCLYRDPVDFANSALVKRDRQCKVERYRSDRMCDGEEYTQMWGTDTAKHEEYEPTIRRNVIVSKGNEICFSVKAVPVCENDDEPTETKTQRLGFHCLPKNDITAKKLISEAKRRPLEELERKSVDYTDSVEVAKMC